MSDSIDGISPDSDGYVSENVKWPGTVLCIQIHMRLARSILLPPNGGTVHQMWRAHNKEHYLKENKIKRLYLYSLAKAFEALPDQNLVQMHSYTIMNNHFHSTMSYSSESSQLSNFMRHSHGIFGQRYNRLKERSGKVAEGRPKTPLIEDDEHQMRVHMYIEANPIRAGLMTIEKLRSYAFSSYGFYAYGVRDSFSKYLTIPRWYLALGATWSARQKKYRQLFREYVENLVDSIPFLAPFIGSIGWKASQKERVCKLAKAMRGGCSGPDNSWDSG